MKRAAIVCQDPDQRLMAAFINCMTAFSSPRYRTWLAYTNGYPGMDVRTAAEDDRFAFSSLDTLVTILRTILLAFAAVAVLVGGFTIFNSLSITVAQRTKEFGLLRMVGASRRQVRGAVLLEALTIGLLASAAGIGVGILLAEGLNALFAAVGAELPTDGMVVATRTIVVSLLVGTLATVLAAMIPARRATKIAPVAALRDSTHAATPGLFARGVRGLASIVGRPSAALGGAAGSLARRNAMRNPGRTGVTALALTIGVMLVTAVRPHRVLRSRIDAGGAQLQQRTGGGAGQFGPPPDPGGQAEHGGLVGFQPQFRQLVSLLPDPVAGVVVKRMVDACLQRHAEIAEILLVPLEHPLEQLVLLGIARHGLTDLLGGEVPRGGEQADDKAEQPLGLALGHGPSEAWCWLQIIVSQVVLVRGERLMKMGWLECRDDHMAERHGQRDAPRMAGRGRAGRIGRRGIRGRRTGAGAGLPGADRPSPAR